MLGGDVNFFPSSILYASYKTTRCKLQILEAFAKALKMEINMKLEIKEHVSTKIDAQNSLVLKVSQI